MNRRIPRAALSFFLAAWLLGVSKAWAAGQVVAVLSSDSAPYQETLAGVRETLGAPLMVVNLTKSERLPDRADVLIAIGGRAAAQSYPASTPLIYCVSPVIYVDQETHRGPLARVYVSPPAHVIIERLKEVQPPMAHLAVLWMNASAIGYVQSLKEEGARRGVIVTLRRLDALEQLPDELRTLKGHVDAIWLPPDPGIINPKSFGLIKQFSWSNNIPLYVAMDSLVGEGAAASVSVSFREMGRKAGSLAAQALTASMPSSDAFGDKTVLTINVSAAAQSGLTVPANMLKNADRVVP